MNIVYFHQMLCGNEKAVPISVNLLHERNDHSKKDKKIKEILRLYVIIKKMRLLKLTKIIKKQIN